MFAHKAPAHRWLGNCRLGYRAVLAFTVIATAILLAACNGGGNESQEQPPPAPGDPADNTAFAFDLLGYSPAGSSSSQSAPLSAALDASPDASQVVLRGQLLPINDGEDDGRVRQFAVRVDENAAVVIEEFDLHLDPGGYSFFVVLTNGTTAYGGFLTDWLILDGARNVVRFTMFPLADPNMDVRAFRAAVESSQVVDLIYDPARVGQTRPKLVVTLASDPRTFVINPRPAPNNFVRIFGVSAAPPHQFYYGDLVVFAPVDQSETNNPTPVLQYSIDDPCFAANGCGEAVLINGLATTARNGDPLTTLVDGSYELTVIYTDQDSVSQVAVTAFTIDATPPVVQVDTGTITSGDGEVTVSPTGEGASSLAVFLDPNQPCLDELDAGSDGTAETSACTPFRVHSAFEVAADETVTVPLTGLSAGPHKLYLVAVDALGNQAITEIDFTVALDSAPQVTISEPAASLYSSWSVPFAFTASDTETAAADLIVSILVESTDDPVNGPWQPAGATVTAASIDVTSDGHYRVSVSATDESSNITTETRKFSVDTLAPAVSIVQPADGSTVHTSKPQLEVESTEQSPFNVRIFLFPGGMGPYDESDLLDIPIDGLLQQQNGAPLVDGRYTVVVELTDAVNLTTVAHSTFTVNAAGPQVKILNPADGHVITNGQVNLRFSAQDASHLEVWLASSFDPNPSEPLLVRVIDPVEPVPRTYQENIEVPLDGAYTVTVVARDENLPGAEAQDSVSFSVNALNPGVEITSPNHDDKYFQPGEPVSVSFIVANATWYRVYLDHWRLIDEGDLDGTTAELTVPLGSFDHDGWHKVIVKVGDGQEKVWDSAWFLIDGTAPVVNILAPEPDQHLTGDEVTIVYAVRERHGIAEQKVWLNGVLQEGATSGSTLTGLTPSETPYLLEVEAVDRAGNSGRASVSFFVDEEEPSRPPHKRGRASCMHTPIAGDDDALEDLHRCLRHHHHHGHPHDD